MTSRKSKADYIDILQNCAPELQAKFGITSMRMFGSVARDEHRANNEIDLFVSMSPVFYNISRHLNIWKNYWGVVLN